MEYVPLWVKSGYSFFRSTLKPQDIVDYAIEEHYQSIGICDSNALFAVLPFYQACKKNNVHAVIGMEVQVVEEDGESYPLLLLANHNEGYQTLMRLTSKVSKGDLSTKLQRSELSSYVQGILAILPSKHSYLSLIIHQSKEKSTSFIQSYQQLFSLFYLGLECDDENDLSLLNDARNLALELGIKTTVVSEVRYRHSSDYVSSQVLECIQAGKTLKQKQDQLIMPRHFRSEKELLNFFTIEELRSTVRIAQSCQADPYSFHSSLKQYPLKEGIQAKDYLSALCYRGLEKRLNIKNIPIEYRNRLSYELDVIQSMGYTNYFLIVWDYVKFAKNQKMLVGPGRGSAAGSLVSYVLGITNVDPIEHHLLFERFLNPERISMPDIDIDFPDNRRDEIIDYLQMKYTNNHVAHVIAFQTFAARQSLRDCAKVYGLSLVEVDIIAKKIPPLFGDYELGEMINKSVAFRDFITGRAIYKDIFKAAQAIEGLPRQTTLHAAGMVLSEEVLKDVVPVYSPSDEVVCTQYDMNYLEEVGLLKMDILGLKNLTIIDDCYTLIEANTKQTLDRTSVALDDPKIYQTIADGKVAGVFQLESVGMRRAIRVIHPSSFKDVVAVLALFRPGPMEFIPSYGKRKAGKEKVDFPHPALEPILKDTYGIIIYQEQIIQILVTMAGFRLGEADLVRRAISKKDNKVLESIKTRFLDGCAGLGRGSDESLRVYQMILRFADYGFNKSHSVAYAMIACQMAYLKCYYPAEFYCSVMNTFAGSIGNGDSKFNDYIQELKSLGISLLLPSINRSNEAFQVEQRLSIRFSLRNIKGLSNLAIKTILNERSKRPFDHFIDFIIRCIPKGISQKNVESLIDSGSFDEFSINRASLHASLPLFITYAKMVASDHDGQIMLDTTVVDRPDYVLVPQNVREDLEREFDVLGLFLSGFPLVVERPRLRKLGFVTSDECKNRVQQSVSLVILVGSIRVVKTKRGATMAHIKAYDEDGMIQITVFPELYGRVEEILKGAQYLAIKGMVQEREGYYILADDIKKYLKQEE